MSTDPGLDELLARQHLRDLGVSHTGTDTDWWDDLYGSGDDTHATANPTTPAKARIGRLPDWRKRETADLTGTGADTADDEADIKDTDPADTPLTGADTDPDPADTTDAGGPAPSGWWTTHPGYWPQPHWPALPEPVHNIALTPRTRAALYNLGAAGAGYALGLAPLFSSWIADCGQHYSVGGALILGVGGSLAIAHVLDRRSRHWWPGLAWAARIPLASALLALGLYAPGTI